MKTYRVRCQGEVLGESRLERADPADRSTRGPFFPEPAYDRFRHVFALLARVKASREPLESAEWMHEYCRARDSLGLELVNEHGTVEPTVVINILEPVDRSNAYVLEVFF